MLFSFISLLKIDGFLKQEVSGSLQMLPMFLNHVLGVCFFTIAEKKSAFIILILILILAFKLHVHKTFVGYTIILTVLNFKYTLFIF